MSALPLLSILAPLENAVLWLLKYMHNDIGLPWAWSIVGTTLLVRIILVPLTVRQIHSMQSLQRHAPEMKELQRKYKGDKQKLQEELARFYKQNRVNPAAPCLPLVAQLPVFVSLYEVMKTFKNHIPKTPPPNLSWLHFVPSIIQPADSHWSGFLLLGVYALSQASSTYFMSATMDKLQRRLMMLAPLIFITVIAHFDVGVVLYWVTTNLWTVGQGLVTRRLVPRTAPGGPVPPASVPHSGSPAAEVKRAAQTSAPQEPRERPARPTKPRRVKRNTRRAG